MTTNARLGYGTTIELADGSSPEAYVTLGEVTNATPPGDTVDQIDATHMQSPNRRREFIAGLIDGGEGSFDMNYDPGSVTDDLINAWLVSGEQRNLRLTYPNLVTETFPATPSSYTRTAPVDDKMTATLTVKKAGDTTWGVTT